MMVYFENYLDVENMLKEEQAFAQNLKKRNLKNTAISWFVLVLIRQNTTSIWSRVILSNISSQNKKEDLYSET